MEMRIMQKNRLKLVFPTIDHKESALTYRQEHFDKGEMIIHGDGGLDEAENYEQWLKKINADLEKDSGGFVPATTYFAFAGDKLVGTIQIRHKLNDYLLKYGGHIGYGIVPSERRKGYATEMLRLALKKCKTLGIEKVLVTCDKNNVASAGTILKNGGFLENEVADDKCRIMQRYWIKVR
jgi:predicted acetyltransferase